VSLPFPPRTLAVRLFLLLLAGVLAAVLVTTGLAMREHGHLLQSFREHAAAERIADMLHLLAALPPEQRSATVRALPSEQWRVETEENASTESAHPSLPTFAPVLAEAVGPSIRVEAAWRTRDPACRYGPGKCPPVRTVGARVLFADGQRVLIEETREPPPPIRPMAHRSSPIC
jgi:hypothetical protein